jgi:hypothetical protein
MTGRKLNVLSAPCWDFVDYKDHKRDGKVLKWIQRIFTKKTRNMIKRNTSREIRESV